MANIRLAGEIAQHQVFWRWLVPSWWRVRREISEFYRNGLKPTDTEIFRDSAELRRCQRDKEFVARETGPFEADLVRDNSGNIAWEAIESGLQVAARLAGIVQITPALLGVLCTDGRLNRDRLRRAYATLQEVSDQFETKVRSLSEKCSRVRPDPNERPFQKLKPQEYSAWLDTASSAFDARAVKLREGLQFFRNERDVDVGKFGDRVAALTNASSRRNEIRREFAKFVDLLNDRPQPELFDWSAIDECADFVITLRQTHEEQQQADKVHSQGDHAELLVQDSYGGEG